MSYEQFLNIHNVERRIVIISKLVFIDFEVMPIFEYLSHLFYFQDIADFKIFKRNLALIISDKNCISFACFNLSQGRTIISFIAISD